MRSVLPPGRRQCRLTRVGAAERERVGLESVETHGTKGRGILGGNPRNHERRGALKDMRGPIAP